MDQEFIKTYVEAIIKVLPDGQKRPMIIVFENRKKYAVDRVRRITRACATKVGGTGIRYHDAISLVFKESFQDTDKLLDWWLYESYDQELYLGEQKFDASDPGNFYDFLVKYRQDWKEQRQCNAPPQKPIRISKDCFRKAIALVRKEQNSLQTVADAARQCSSIFNVHGNTSKYLDALILLLQDLFGDANKISRRTCGEIPFSLSYMKYTADFLELGVLNR